MDPKVDEIISFYVNRDPKEWFLSPESLDNEIRSKFGDYVEKARSTEIDGWAESPKGALALILLLDQFPRNIFRNSHESYSSDHKAHSVATVAIAKKFDREMGKKSKYQQYFFYLPFMHAEDLCSQVACLALLENLVASCEPGSPEKEHLSDGIGFAERHIDCIAQLGRFPKRNESIGRTSTEEEKQYLEEHPAGF